MNKTNKQSGVEHLEEYLPGMALPDNLTSKSNIINKEHQPPATDVCSRRIGVPFLWDNNSTEDLVKTEEEDKMANLSPLEMVRLLSDTKWESEMLKGVTEGEHSILGVERDLLSFIAGVYDPCGFIAPWCLEGRNLFQTINSPKIPYKSDLPPDIKELANTIFTKRNTTPWQ